MVGFLRCASVGLIAGVLLLPAIRASAQTSAQAPSAFEVASLRLSDPKSEDWTKWDYENTNRFTAKRTSLKILIAIAYGLSDNRVEGLPGWADSAYYDANAKAEGDVLLTDKTLQPLLQQLLAERLQLKVHRETRQVKGYALLLDKGKSKLVPAKGPTGELYILPNGIQGNGVSLKTLADLLSRPLGRPVLDKTGLDGTYDVKLEFAPLNDPESTLPSPPAAIEEQLGLKLESATVPREILVVDHVERVPPVE
jgi:uncharacterized protein (TIGR03435 family)